MTKIFRRFLVKIFFLIFLQKLTWFPKNSGLPGGLLYVCYGILVKILNFTTAKPGRNPHFQIWSKTAKFAKKPQKWPFFGSFEHPESNFKQKSIFSLILSPFRAKKVTFFDFSKLSRFHYRIGTKVKFRPFLAHLGPENWVWINFYEVNLFSVSYTHLTLPTKA